MDIPGGTPLISGYSVTGGNAWSGFPLNSNQPDSAYPLRNSSEGMLLDRSESRAFPLAGKTFSLSAPRMGKGSEAERIKLRQAAEGFEAIFIRQLLRTMRSTSTEGGMYGSGATGEMYADMVENALAEAMAKEGRFGIADSLCRRLSVRDSSAAPAGEESVKIAKEGVEK